MADTCCPTEASAFNGVNIPRLTERIAILATRRQRRPYVNGLAGWHSGQELAYVGWGSALAAKAMVRAEGARIRTTKQRYRAGWLHAAELVTGTTIVTTEFSEPVRTIVDLHRRTNRLRMPPRAWHSHLTELIEHWISEASPCHRLSCQLQIAQS